MLIRLKVELTKGQGKGQGQGQGGGQRQGQGSAPPGGYPQPGETANCGPPVRLEQSSSPPVTAVGCRPSGVGWPPTPTGSIPPSPPPIAFGLISNGGGGGGIAKQIERYPPPCGCWCCRDLIRSAHRNLGRSGTHMTLQMLTPQPHRAHEEVPHAAGARTPLRLAAAGSLGQRRGHALSTRGDTTQTGAAASAVENDG